MRIIIILSSIFFFMSCSDNSVVCDKIPMEHYISILQDTSIDKTNDIDLFSFQFFDSLNGNFISEKGNVRIRDKYNTGKIVTFNFKFDNYLTKNTKIIVKYLDKQYVIAEIKIEKVNIKTTFLTSYDGCVISEYKVNGVNKYCGTNYPFRIEENF